MSEEKDKPRVVVVVPSIPVAEHILAVLSATGPEVHRIFVVDDACPQSTGDLVEAR
jgi:dolichol-phosphate mannosyltransferase